MQASLARRDHIPAFIGRAGSVPDNFGSTSPASWCLTLKDISSVGQNDLYQADVAEPLALQYAASDAQVGSPSPSLVLAPAHAICVLQQLQTSEHLLTLTSRQRLEIKGKLSSSTSLCMSIHTCQMRAQRRASRPQHWPQLQLFT